MRNFKGVTNFMKSLSEVCKKVQQTVLIRSL